MNGSALTHTALTAKALSFRSFESHGSTPSPTITFVRRVVHAPPRFPRFYGSTHPSFCTLTDPAPPPPPIKKQIEPSGGPPPAGSSSNRGGAGDQGSQTAGTGGRASTGSRRASGGGGGGGHRAAGAGGAGRRGENEYCYDPWGGWVLENYSLYTTLLAAFVRKAGTMSFKVRRGSGGRRGGVAGGPWELFVSAQGASRLSFGWLSPTQPFIPL